MPPAILLLHLIPIDNSFGRKTLLVPYAPDVLRIGRQTYQETGHVDAPEDWIPGQTN